MTTKSSNKSPSSFIQLSLDFSGSFPDSFSNGDVTYLRIGSGSGYRRYISSDGYPWTLWLKTLRLERGFINAHLSPSESFRRGSNAQPYCLMHLNGKIHLVHRVVAQYFLNGGEPIPPGMEVDHLDSNPQNNAVTNLEMVTTAENYRRRNVKHGYKRMTAHQRKLHKEAKQRRMARYHAQRAAAQSPAEDSRF